MGPDGYTWHSDHRTMPAWVEAATEWTATSARVLYATTSQSFLDEFADVHRNFDVFFSGQPSATAPADMALDLPLDGHLLDRKFAALAAQNSQTRG